MGDLSMSLFWMSTLLGVLGILMVIASLTTLIVLYIWNPSAFTIAVIELLEELFRKRLK